MRTGDLVVQLQYAEVTCERSRTCRKKVFLRVRKTHRERHIHRDPHTTSTHSTSHFSLHTYRITRSLTSYVMKNAFGPLVV